MHSNNNHSNSFRNSRKAMWPGLFTMLHLLTSHVLLFLFIMALSGNIYITRRMLCYTVLYVDCMIVLDLIGTLNKTQLLKCKNADSLIPW